MPATGPQRAQKGQRDRSQGVQGTPVSLLFYIYCTYITITTLQTQRHDRGDPFRRGKEGSPLVVLISLFRHGKEGSPLLVMSISIFWRGKWQRAGEPSISNMVWRVRPSLSCRSPLFDVANRGESWSCVNSCQHCQWGRCWQAPPAWNEGRMAFPAVYLLFRTQYLILFHLFYYSCYILLYLVYYKLEIKPTEPISWVWVFGGCLLLDISDHVWQSQSQYL